MVKVLAFVQGEGGCDWYRVKQPLTAAKISGQLDVRFFSKGDDYEWFDLGECAADLDEKMSWADIIFIPRLTDPRVTVMSQEFQKLGKKIVGEWDDNMFNVSPFNPHYEQFGLEEVSCQIGSETVKVWEDGRNINLERNKSNMQGRVDALKMCDLLLVTTDTLASVYRPYANNIRVAPNSIDPNLWKKTNLKPRSGIRMGWFGGHSHYDDWLIIAPILKQFMEDQPEVTLVILGTKFDGTLKGIDPSRIEFHPWVHTQAYPYKAALLDLDFAIIPLAGNDFNACKSPIKWLEMASLSVPSVASFVPPYSHMMDLVRDNGIFVEKNDSKAWLQAMKLMATRPELRLRMAEAARQTVERFYDANETYKFWVDAFEEVMLWPRQTRRQLLAS